MTAPPVSKARVQEIYRTKCEKCHEPEGRAAKKGEGMSFADGVPETGMNAFSSQLTPEEVQAIAKYVRSLDKTAKK